MKQYNKVKGTIGEHMALEYLMKKGYKIVECNYRNSIGEIDLIAKDKNTLVFVEVKYKDNLLYGFPREMVGARKQSKIRTTALAYLKKNRLIDTVPIRFDVIEIVGEKITHLPNAF